MGAWSVSVTGNDTAQDLKEEYRVAFYYYSDIKEALNRIDKYVRKGGFDKSDESEWCNYYYSLADFMWRYGILTDEVKNEALRLINSGFGLEIWADSGQKTLEARKKALQKFKEKIESPQPLKKKISIGTYMNPIFETGDIIAFQLQTANKIYTGKKANISEKDFKEADGKYVAIRKICDQCSWRSAIEPAVKNIWPYFQLYNKVFSKPPELKDVINTESVNFVLDSGKNNPDGIFMCEGSLSYFRRRKYIVLGKYQERRKHIVLGKYQEGIEDIIEKYDLNNNKYTYYNYIEKIYFGINKPWYNADEILINSISDRL